MNKPVYLIDTNVFIRFESGDIYDKECFPEVFDLFLKLIEEGKIISLDKVKDELKESVFVDKYSHIFKESVTVDVYETYVKLREQYPEYFDYYAKDKSWSADPFLIMYAYHNNLCIVTQEEFQNSNPSKKNYTIMTLCEKLGAVCIDNNNLKGNINTYKEGFGCICFSELIRIEKELGDKNKKKHTKSSTRNVKY